MQKQFFIFRNALKDFLQNRFLAAVLIVISFVSILATLCAGNMAWGMWQDYRFAEIPDADKLIVAEFFLFSSDTVQTEEMVRNTLLTGMKQKPEQTEFGAFSNMVVEWGEEAAVCNVQGNTGGFMDIRRFSLSAGEDFAALDGKKNCCILKEGGRMYKKGAAVGDVLTVNGEEFWVAGIVRCPTAYGEIFISYDKLAEMTVNQSPQFQALLKYGEKAPLAKVKPHLTRTTANLTECCTGTWHLDIYRKSIIQRSEERFLAAGMLFLFAAVNFLVMIRGKIVLERKRLGIRVSIGAPRGALREENLIRMEITITAAFLMALAGAYLLVQMRALGLNRRMGWEVGAAVWLLYSLLGILAETASLNGLLKKDQTFGLLREA